MQMRLLRAHGWPVVMVHECDPDDERSCEFAHFFQNTTPGDLIADGIYADIALGLFPGFHRQISLALIAKALGATPKRHGVGAARQRSQRARGVASILSTFTDRNKRVVVATMTRRSRVEDVSKSETEVTRLSVADSCRSSSLATSV